MLNFRFHIVSLVAVFLALAIGVIMGSTVIDRALVDTLEDQQQTLRAEVNNLLEDNAALRDELEDLRERSERLAEEGGERLLSGVLTDVPVLVLAVRGVDGSAVDDLHELLQTAGAVDEGTLWLTDRFRLEDEDAVADLAELLEAGSGTSPAELRAAALDAVAVTVQEGVRGPSEGSPPGGPDTAPDGTDPEGVDGGGAVGGEADGVAEEASEAVDLVAALREAGFVDFDAPEGRSDEVADLVDPGSRVVLVGGATADVPDREVAVPLARALVEQGAAGAPTVPLLAAEAQPEEEQEEDDGPSFVALLREDDVGDRLSTVDNLDTFAGLVATVLGLQDLGAGQRGHYGTGPGAERLVPAPRE